MKHKKIIKIVSLFICFFVITTSTIFAEDFRNAKWGMTKEQVKSSEKSAKFLKEDKNLIAYSDEVAGEDMLIAYEFQDGKLIRGAYEPWNQLSNASQQIRKYLELSEKLKKKYGETETKEVWVNENSIFKSDLASALSIGDYELYTFWETEKSSIVLVLKGENFKTRLNIYYKDKKTQYKENLDGL